MTRFQRFETCEDVDFRWADLVAHVWFLRAVRLHVLRQSFLHGVNLVAHGADELGHLRLHGRAQGDVRERGRERRKAKEQTRC